MPEVAVLIERLYRMPGCEIGGPLHSVIDDGNLKDGHLRSVIETKGTSPWGTWAEDAERLAVKIAALMLQMTGTQRRKLSARDYYSFR